MPQLGERVHAFDIGRKSGGFVRWVRCPTCELERWIHERKQRGVPPSEEPYKVCSQCRIKEWVKTRDYKRENHPNWKGRLKRSTGYISINKPEHHRASKAGYVWEHILIWEQEHGCKLPDGYVIHHLNGIKDDNRPVNLSAMPRRGHSPTLLVKDVQKRLRDAEAELSQQNFFTDKAG